MTTGAGEMKRLRTLGRGASGAVVSLYAAGADELVAVKSARGSSSGAAAQLRREWEIMSSLRSPHVLPCLGFRAAASAAEEEHECQLILEFAPGGSLADAAARSGGRLEEPAARAFAADVARGLAYLHDGESIVHGDVKARNVVVGGDGRAMLADFGCARAVGSEKGHRPIIGGTPAFMAPEVARGEEQGPEADVWALGCTVIEMVTGRPPWSQVVDDVVAAVRMIGYTDAVPEAPAWLSPEGKDFLGKCLCRDAGERWTAARLLEHPFLVSAPAKAADVKGKWVSPKSTLDAALWESDADDEDDDELLPESPADRIKSLAGAYSALPEWESDDDGWIEVCSSSSHSELSDAAASVSQEVKFPDATAVATPSEQTPHCELLDLPVVSTAAETAYIGNFWGDEPEAELFGADLDAGDDDPVHNVGGHRQQQDILENFIVVMIDPNISDEEIVKAPFPAQFAPVILHPPLFVF
ncbi:hypothetical protein PR202_ga05843 [Eleusine coracana subsp. coracana]|uniref:Protein kinase domain-containing protein n=1 Tax=Eleusine coracana subsp. coracana TaxID=191504 RepID=A0AAV5BV73_ELECO|nr:hypothetical protein PR202_ga05843 [Eleusine coracana subsp. coracana]